MTKETKLFYLQKILMLSKNKYAKNTGWLFLERIFRILINFLVTIYLIKYLGPDNFGLISYSISYVSLFSSISALGLDNLIVRDLVNDFEKRNLILGTSLCLRLIASIFTIILIYIIIYFSNEDLYTSVLILIIGSSFIFQSFNVIDFYFQSQVQSRFVVVTQSFSLIIASIIKVILIIIKADLIYFAFVFSLETLLFAIGLLITFYKTQTKKLAWKFDRQIAKNLLKQAFPLILAGVVVSIYMKIDQIMIKKMLNNSEAGFYSAAVKICELWYFLPMSISTSLFPAIISAKKISKELYLKRMQQLYDLMAWLSIGIAIPLTIFSQYLITFLYGEQFSSSNLVLQIYIWSGVSTFLGVASSQFLIAENFTKISFYRTLIGMITNLALNFYLIPKIGIVGSAIATVVSYSFATFSVIFFKDTRLQSLMMLKSIFFISILDYKKR